MKKLLLLGALVCAGQMYGMESSFAEIVSQSSPASADKAKIYGPKETSFLEVEHISQLPKEIKQEIVNKSLAMSDTFQKTIWAIKETSALFGIQYDKLFNNIKDFTTLVHMLSHKFKMPVNVVAGHLIKIPTATTYITLSEELGQAVKNDQIDTVAQLINQGADVNFIIANSTMLELAVNNRSQNAVEIVKILLDHGANPWAQAPQSLTCSFASNASLGDLIEEDEFFDAYSVDESQSDDSETYQIFSQFEQLIREALPKHQSYSS